MTFLSDSTIKKFLFDKNIPEGERIKINPEIQDIQIGQCSIDLSLSNQFARFRQPYFSIFNTKVFDLKDKEKRKDIQKNWYKYYTRTEEEGIIIKPNEVIIAITKEWVRLPKNMCGLITGRSSFSRMGIEVQLTQDLHQPGHNAQILLQIKNNSPFSVRLYPNMRIAQLMIGMLDQNCDISYDENPNSKYVGGKKGIEANWFQDFELENKNIINTPNKLEITLNIMLIISLVVTLLIAIKRFIPLMNNLDITLIISASIVTVLAIIRTIILIKR